MPSAPPRPRSRQVNVLQVVALLIAFVLVATLGGVLSAGLVMPVVATTSALTNTSVELFDELPEELVQVPLSEKSTILAADGQVLATFYDQNRIVVTLDQVSPQMRNAVIAIEDKRFYEHGGVDLTGMTRALVTNALTDETQGASTLTQQYVKNALIQAALDIEDPAERAAAIDAAREAKGVEGIARKLQEAKLAIALEQRMTKDEILAAYLNISQFGLSVYGVEAAAQHYFSISAADLSYLQAATIAGITQAPGDLDPERNPEASEARRNDVLFVMEQQGYITPEEYAAGVATPIADTLVIGQTRLGCMTANDIANAGYFCDYVTKIIAQNPAFGETAAERSRLLYRGGLTIQTTLDPRLQALADASVKGAIPVDDPSGVANAISVVEPGTGNVLAMAQNRIYNSASDAGPGQTAVNYNTDSAYGSSGGFHPGSAFKPFTLVQWLKEGHSLREMIDGRLRQSGVPMDSFNASCTGFAGGVYKFGNAEGSGAVMSVLDATRNSVNSGYIEMATQIDLCGVFDTAASLGVHKANGDPVDVLPSNVLGSTEVAPLTMASAFAAFAADGLFCEPIAITSVVGADGIEIPVPSANCRQALSPEIARAMSYALGFVWQGTAKSVDPLPGGRPSSGKTGTTSQNEYTWFVGFTPQMSSAVWVGFPDAMRPVQDLTINGRFVRNAYGSTIAAPVWRAFMAPAHEGLPIVGFNPPSSAQVDGVRVSVPDVAGRSESSARSILEDAGFNVRVSDAPTYSGQPAGTVAWTEPAAGSRVVRGSVVTLVLSLGVDPAAARADDENNGNGNDDGAGDAGRQRP
ncbi:MAG TPA: penicillin-binding protein [Actinotalea sp.]|nr:penicillin-binding protein [Actinotalea sp.]